MYQLATPTKKWKGAAPSSPDNRNRTASVGGFAVEEDIDHEELAEQLGVPIMNLQEMYGVFKVSVLECNA